MNPHQKNKVDIGSLNSEEQKLFRLYGKLPNRNDLLQNKLKERKYFDSGDYALSKAGKASDVGVTSIGSQHPLPENIPHLSSPSSNNGNNSSLNGANGLQSCGQGGSPVKESSFLHHETSMEDSESPPKQAEKSTSSLPVKEGAPIR